MMKDVISFSVPGSMGIHELHIGATLTRFLEFDLEYFSLQCVEAYKKSRTSGGDALVKSLALKEYLRNCHPYCAATLKTDFDKVALDCIIDHICLTEDLGLEELWVRYLASKDPFEKAIFERITDYKTGFAINQWTNLVRMRAYAASKTAVVYGDDASDIAVHRARALYYDMTFRVAAMKLGFDSSELPQIRYYSLPLLPEAPQLLKNAVNTLEAAMKQTLSVLEKTGPIKGRECVRDQRAGMALAAIRSIKQPDEFELRQFIQMYRALPDTVYEPTGLKAVIDLEFDQLMEKGYYLKPSGSTYIREKYNTAKPTAAEAARFLLPPPGPAPPPAVTPPPPAAAQRRPRGRPKGSAKAPGEQKTAAGEAVTKPPVPAAAQKPSEEKRRPGRPKGSARPPGHAVDETPKQPVILKADTMPKPGRPADVPAGRVEAIIRMAEDQGRTSSRERTLQEINTRCNLIWTSMNVRMGWSITSEEASAWFKYLTKLRYGIGTGELKPAALDRFLDATLEVFNILPENV